MYKNDSMTSNQKCNPTMLRNIIEGKGCLCGDGDVRRMENGIGDNCIPKSGFGLKGYPLASVYAPLQEFDNIYDLDNALGRGTMFAELDLPFEGRTISKSGKGGKLC